MLAVFGTGKGDIAVHRLTGAARNGVRAPSINRNEPHCQLPTRDRRSPGRCRSRLRRQHGVTTPRAASLPAAIRAAR